MIDKLKRYNWEYDGEKMGLVEREDGICVLYSDLSQDTPKQGDTVWVRNNSTDKWQKWQFVAEVNRRFYTNCTKLGSLAPWKYMTTEDPYALKYELTAQEALVAIGQGKIIESNEYEHLRYKWTTDISVFTEQLGWYVCRSIPVGCDNMYAIVEE